MIDGHIETTPIFPRQAISTGIHTHVSASSNNDPLVYGSV
jgi:hypothetical protein